MSKVAAIQMASGPQVAANLLVAGAQIAAAVAEGAQLVTLPENFAHMGMRETDKIGIAEQPGQGPIQQFLADTARKHGVWLLGGTIPMVSPDDSRVYAASLLFNELGQQVARYNKIHLFDVEVLATGERYQESDSTYHGEDVVVVDSPVGRLGLAVCYDLRFPELFRQMMQQGAEVMLLPSAFTEVTGKAHWEVLLRARAIENLSYVVAPAQGGYHVNGRTTHGHSMIVDPWGVVVAERQSNTMPGYVMAELHLDTLATTRRTFPALEHGRL